MFILTGHRTYSAQLQHPVTRLQLIYPVNVGIVRPKDMIPNAMLIVNVSDSM